MNGFQVNSGCETGGHCNHETCCYCAEAARVQAEALEFMRVAPVKLRYDGKYDFMPADSARQWTIMSHFVDVNGQDRFKGSFGLQGLIELGIVTK